MSSPAIRVRYLVPGTGVPPPSPPLLLLSINSTYSIGPPLRVNTARTYEVAVILRYEYGPLWTV